MRKQIFVKKAIGELRIRNIPVETSLHKENGTFLWVNPGIAYFNPALSSERMRLLEKVNEDSIVYDAFAGVGPFSIILSKKAKPQQWNKGRFWIEVRGFWMKYLRT